MFVFKVEKYYHSVREDEGVLLFLVFVLQVTNVHVSVNILWEMIMNERDNDAHIPVSREQYPYTY